MNKTDSTLVPARGWTQWRLSTWFILVALLGWAFAISPRHIVITDTLPLPGGKQSISTTTYLNPHYFGPVFALVAFASWKDVSNQRGFDKPVFRRRARRIAYGLSMLAIAVAIGALCARAYYAAAASGTGASSPDFWARMMTANSSLVFYSSAGLAIGLVVGLMLSTAESRKPAVPSP